MDLFFLREIKRPCDVVGIHGHVRDFVHNNDARAWHADENRLIPHDALRICTNRASILRDQRIFYELCYMILKNVDITMGS